MEDWKMRTRALLGDEGVEALARARVAVFGLGGVGGHAAEALARAGVGTLDLFDGDDVAATNLNRQIVATLDTLGKGKAQAMAERCRQCAPGVQATAYRVFYLPENADEIPLGAYDYIVDAVDTVSAKIELAVRAAVAGVPTLSGMRFIN